MKQWTVTAFAVAFLVTSGCRSTPIDTSEYPDDWPTTLEAATADIIGGMSEADKKTVRETKKGDLILFHHGWGTGIRNSFGLWQGNKALLKACGGGHPDDASMVIIESVWKTLRQQKNSEQSDREATSKPAPVPGAASEASHP